IADLCAAPGGKTTQLALAGARVTAVDRSPLRLARLKENLARLDLAADVVAADVLEWQAGPFDAVLLDAPCSSTGTIRRHLGFALLGLQRAAAIDEGAPGPRERHGAVEELALHGSEGEAQVAALLERDPRLSRL